MKNKIDFQSEVPKLIEGLRITDVVASEIMEVAYGTFQKKKRLQYRNRFTEKDYKKLVKFAKQKKI